MHVVKWSVIALTVAAGTSQIADASSQDEAEGFIAGSTLELVEHNYYFDHDGKNGSADGRDWSNALSLDFASGFTQGTVGFGVDAFAFWGLRLDNRYDGAGNVPLDNDGSKQEWTRLGGAIKARFSDTVVKYGTLQPTAPVFAVGGDRITPQYATGFSIASSEIEGLDLEGGHFTSASGPRSMGNNESLYAAYAEVQANTADFVGGKYAITDGLSVSLYGSEFEDVWRQYYGAANYVIPLSNEQSLTFDLNAYRTLDEGSAKAGDINTTTFSLMGSYAIGAHTFSLAFQKNHGDTPFDYVGVGNEDDTGDSIFLANSVQISDFNAPNEKSAQVRYDLNLAAYGIPGLSFMALYAQGWDADYTKMSSSSAYFNPDLGDNGKHHETNIEAKYVVQTGPAKNLSVLLRQAFHNGNSDYADTDTNETRLVIEYPLSIL